MITEGTEADLLEKAEAEEKLYSWAEAAKLYEQVAKLYVENNRIDKAAEIYKRVGDNYLEAIYSAETAEEYVERCKYAMLTYERAANLFKEVGNKAKELECEAEKIFAEGILGNSVKEAKVAFNQSYELMIESSELFSKREDRENLARTLVRATISLMYLIRYGKDAKEIEQLSQKGCAVAERGWKLSKEVKNNIYLGWGLFAETFLRATFQYLGNLKQKDNIGVQYKKFFLRCEESIKISERCDELRAICLIYFVAADAYSFYGYHFIANESEQRKYLDKGLEFFEKGLVSARKINNKAFITMYIFNSIWWGLLGGKIEYVQKRIIKDIKELLEISKIFDHTNNPIGYLTLFVPSFYYTQIAQMSFLNPVQRKTYAEKAIEYGKRAIKKYSFLFGSYTAYASLVWSYALLATLTIEINERDQLIQKMLKYAYKANEIGEKFEGGFARAAGYSSLYRAYITISEITDNEAEQIKMLSKAIEAQKNYIPHSIESRTGIILAKIRLGLLYEKLGIITKDIDQLIQAKNILLDANKESEERGYFSYGASVYEYLARIEDRLGNHSASTENYKQAQEIYRKSLNNIEYKPLKKRVIEKMNYAQAWAFIEQAKLYHKREDHLKAKKDYNQASEILKTIRRYNYEAPYYTSWSLLEEAEQFSKEEKQKKAIQMYEQARNAFKDAVKSLEQTLGRSKEKNKKEGIQKLEKVAQSRMDYCSARINLENARILGKQGNHSEAAENFALAASQFRQVCEVFSIERERKELEAVYYLCRAWEVMELAEKYKTPDRFAEAARLFICSSNLFADSKFKFLSSANSSFCQALEYGCKFDESIETETKIQFYQKIKLMLRKAADLYRDGGSKSGAEWALATSTYFDAGWYLLKADKEEDINEKTKLLGIGSGYLESALELFDKAGYKDKVKDIQEQLDMVKREEKIILTALNTVKRPSVSTSTEGIIAPACPIETSQSPRMSEIREIEAETRRVLTRRASMDKSNLDSKDISKVKKDTL
jgi:tetratricopeptide (TPR) repeat protein